MSIDKPTSFDIAALAGVSQPTVSRALRGDRTVSEATRKRVEAIARQLNYAVDKNASPQDRKRVGWGKSGAGRLDLVRRRVSKQKQKYIQITYLNSHRNTLVQT